MFPLNSLNTRTHGPPLFEMSSQNPAEGGNSFLSAVYAAKSPQELQSVYNDWAASYDTDLDSLGYSAPQKAANVLAQLLPPTSQTRVLDAGCGTGLVGAALSRHGFKHIDGADLSPGMLKQAAKTGAYENLKEVDLSKPLEGTNYDAVICVGTLTEGHVGPEALRHFAEAVKPGGLVVATVLGTIWEPKYREFVDGMVQKAEVKVASQDETEYRPGFPIKLRVLVLQRTK